MGLREERVGTGEPHGAELSGHTVVNSRDSIRHGQPGCTFPFVPRSHLALLDSPRGPFCETPVSLPVISEAGLSLAGRGQGRHLLTSHFCFLQEMKRKPAQVIHNETLLMAAMQGQLFLSPELSHLEAGDGRRAHTM